MKPDSFTIVAIDGGAASGKSSTARTLSKRLGLMHVNTGAHYRTLTHALLKAGADPAKPETILALLESLTVETRLQEASAQLAVNDRIPEESEIHSPEVNAAVSLVAAIPKVRKFLFQYQRNQVQLARQKNYPGLVMEGRDIGSVILPDADFCFFLHADAATRAERRAKEGLTDSISQRDELDSSRKTAPLKCPEHAIKIDTGQRSLQAVVDLICEHIDASHD
jgi:cytidylate kinase